MLDVPDVRFSDLPPQSRAGKATYLLLIHGELKTSELAEHLGYATNAGVNYLMKGIAGAVPVYQPEAGCWAILRSGRDV